MLNSTILYTCVFIASVLVSSASQILLKKSAQKEYPSFIAQYLNAPVIFAYVLFLGATLVTIFAYKGVPLSAGPILESLSYVFVALLSFFILKERLSRKGIIGMIVIVVGVVIFSL